MSNTTKPRSPGPDFSGIDSQAKAEELFRRGELEKLFLMPPEFGGQDIPQSTLLVPVGIAAIREGVDANIIVPPLEKGHVTRYRTSQVYQGASFIPIAITVAANDPGDFRTTIDIWGEVLTRG